ncbi:MAG: DUF1294 domain-containing protein [Pseudomonadota bacterium]
MTKSFLLYLLVINILTFVLSILDKGFAVYNRRRIPEGLLLTLSFVGGAIGAKLAQMISGHKKLKVDYRNSLALIALLQFGLGLAVWSHGVRPDTGQFYDRLSLSWLSNEEEARDVRHVSDGASMPRRFGPGS